MHIMFVCTGNICRSPMAEGLLRLSLERRGIDGVKVTSTGTWGQDGSRATEHAWSAAAASGAPLEGHRAQTFSAQLAEDADLIVAMTSVHLREIEDMAPGTAQRTRLLKEISLLEPEIEDDMSPDDRLAALLSAPRPAYMRAHDLDDPMGFPLPVYERCRDEISKGIDSLVRLLFD
jgi:protein-tyrosine phosphatase